MKNGVSKITAFALIFCLLATFGGIFAQGSTAEASTSQISGSKMLYLTDQQWMANMIKTFGPEASKAHRNKIQFDLNNSGIKPNAIQTTAPLSVNWCGYYLDNGNNTKIYGVRAHFNARYTSGNNNPSDSAWVGIGRTGNNILQIGFDMTRRVPWWEDTSSQTIEQTLDTFPPIYPDDDVNVGISFDYGYEWYISIWDKTTNQAWGEDWPQVPSDNICEWILENNSGFHIGNFGLVPGNIGTVTFLDCAWWDYNRNVYNMNAGPGIIYQQSLQNLYNETLSPSSIYGNTEFWVTH